MHTYEAVNHIHRYVDACRSHILNERGILWWLDRSLKRDDCGPHPDDIPELESMLSSDAETLRRIANELDLQLIEIKRNVLQYQQQAAE